MADDFDDMSADIEAAMKGDAPVEAVAAEPILPADTQETPEQTEARTRDENGRFAKAPEDVQDTPASGEEPEKTILPPRTWTGAAKSKFAQLDPDVQQEVLRREREIEAGKQQWDTKAEAFNKLDAVIAPVRDRLTMSGLTPDTYIAALVRADEMLRGPQSLQAIQMLAQQYGINLGAISGGPQAQPQQWQPDPQYQALQSQFQQLQARLDQDAQAKQEQDHQATLARIEAFASDPANIYFDNVRGEMAALISRERRRICQTPTTWLSTQGRTSANSSPQRQRRKRKPHRPGQTDCPSPGRNVGPPRPTERPQPATLKTTF